MNSWTKVEAAIGLLVPIYLYVQKMGSLGAQEGLETELMTETDLVADTGPGRPVGLNRRVPLVFSCQVTIRTKNGASRCPKRP